MATILLANAIGAANVYWGAAISLAAGYIDNQLFGTTTRIEGARMDSLQLQDSAYGGMIPYAFGTVRTKGNIIWATGFVEHKKTEKSGGKGGNKQKVTTYSYSISFAVSLCKGPVIGVSRIWADGDLVYPKKDGISFRLYHGTEDQLPDSFMESYNGGSGTTPAYRGQAYVMFQDLDLTDFGNRIPQLQFEVITATESILADENEDTVFRTGRTDYSEFNEHLIKDKVLRDLELGNLDIKKVYINKIFKNCTFINCYFAGGIISSIFDCKFINCDFRQSGLQGKLAGVKIKRGIQIYSASQTSKYKRGQMVEFQPNMGRPNIFVTLVDNPIGIPSESADYFNFTEGHLHDEGLGLSGNSIFENCNFDSAVIPNQSNARFTGCSMKDSLIVMGNVGNKYEYCDMRRSFLQYFNDNTLISCDLSDVIFGRTHRNKFTSCNLDNAKLNQHPTNGLADVLSSGDHFIQCSLRGVSYLGEIDSGIFEYCDLRNFKTLAQNCVLRNSNFNYSDLRGMTFPRYDSSWVSHWTSNNDFSNTKLKDTVFESSEARVITMKDGNIFNNADFKTADPGWVSLKPVNLSTIIQQVAKYSKIPLNVVDCGSLIQLVDGYIINSQTTFRKVVEELQTPYFFNVRETNSMLQFVPKTYLHPIEVKEDDFGAVKWGEEPIDKLSIVDDDALELPAQINLKFYDYSKDYQVGTVKSRRLYYSETSFEKTVEVQIVMTPGSAQQIVDQILVDIWTNRIKYTGQLGNKWSCLEPVDVIGTTVNNVSRVFQLTKVDYDGSLVKFEGMGFKTPKVIIPTRYEPELPPVVTRGDIVLHLLDLPLLTSDDGPGFYVAAASDQKFTSVVLYESDANDQSSFKYIDTLEYAVTCGTTNTALGNGQALFFDRANTVEVTLISGTLESVPEEDLVMGTANSAIIGEEIIQFANATLTAENTYTLSTLLRGRRGTDWAMGTHVIGERFILLQSGAIEAEPMGIDKIGKQITYRSMYIGATEGTNTQFTHTGKGYKPYSVCHVRGTRTSDDLEITWIRRTRIGGAWRNNVDVLLSETVEKYMIEIMQESVIKRSLSSVEPRIVYSKSQQIADFGSPQQSVKVRIYQISDKVGKGYVKEAIV